MRFFDFSTWQSLLTTLIGIALVTLLGIGIRLLAMTTIQQRRERANRQINERLRALIAAYKTLGGSFTGNLLVDPRHLRDMRLASEETGSGQPGRDSLEAEVGSDRARRIRDAVEAALADILLLGTEEQVRLAQHAARELVAGRPVPTADIVVSLRDFIREALDLDPIPSGIEIPTQGPARPSSSSGGGRGRGGGDNRDNERRGGGGGGLGGGGMGMGGLAAGGMGLGAGLAGDMTGDGTGGQ